MSTEVAKKATSGPIEGITPGNRAVSTPQTDAGQFPIEATAEGLPLFQAVPLWVLKHKLKDMATAMPGGAVLRVYLCLLGHQDFKTHLTRPGFRIIQAETGIGSDSIGPALAWLVADGMIELVQAGRPRNAAIYRVVQCHRAGVKIFKHPAVENAEKTASAPIQHAPAAAQLAPATAQLAPRGKGPLEAKESIERAVSPQNSSATPPSTKREYKYKHPNTRGNGNTKDLTTREQGPGCQPPPGGVSLANSNQEAREGIWQSWADRLDRDHIGRLSNTDKQAWADALAMHGPQWCLKAIRNANSVHVGWVITEQEKTDERATQRRRQAPTEPDYRGNVESAIIDLDDPSPDEEKQRKRVEAHVKHLRLVNPALADRADTPAAIERLAETYSYATVQNVIAEHGAKAVSVGLLKKGVETKPTIAQQEAAERKAEQQRAEQRAYYTQRPTLKETANLKTCVREWLDAHPRETAQNRSA